MADCFQVIHTNTKSLCLSIMDAPQPLDKMGADERFAARKARIDEEAHRQAQATPEPFHPELARLGVL